jgi:HPt (histidine-containing phosphotransfer) domain-containing protein
MTNLSELDPAALTRLDKLGGPGFAQRIIGIFLTEAPRRAADARRAAEARDGPALAHAVHALISSAGNLGATGLSDYARQLEREAELNRWDVLPERVDRLVEILEVIRSRLLQSDTERTVR